MGALSSAMFAAGCFWGVEAKFRATEGVVEVTSGYAGGVAENPSYEQVCTDLTGHAEVVLVKFDPARVSYEALLDKFFTIHDPTQVDRQGHNVGKQYRSAVFVYDEAQRAAVGARIAALDASGKFADPVATQVADAPHFWPAEEYHQRYFEKNPAPVCGIG